MADRNHRREVAVGVLLLVALTLFAWMAIMAGSFNLGKDRIRVAAFFDSVSGLDKGAVVMVAGVEVGAVTSLDVVDGRARVDLAVDTDLALTRDAIATIRARSVLGEKYVALVPRATGAPLQDGDVLEETAGHVEIDDLVAALTPLVAVLDPDTLGAVVGALGDAIAEDPERIGRMLADAEATLSTLRQATEEFPALVGEGRALVGRTRTTVDRARAALDRVEPILESAERAAPHLEDAAAGLPGVVGDGGLAVEELRALLQGLGRSTDDLETLLENLAAFDRYEIRRLLREEGVLVRIIPRQVEPLEED